ncbi:MAG: transposase, partial [Chlorobium sp.]|uniref:transposase n=1 Tax=Chlorobium sp. TaxID=1095 RepID=UPI0025B8C2F9
MTGRLCNSLFANIHTDQPNQQALFPDCFEVSVAPVKGKKVVLDFQGGNATSDAGVLLLKEVESMTRIVPKLADCIADSRRTSSVMHSIPD